MLRQQWQSGRVAEWVEVGMEGMEGMAGMAGTVAMVGSRLSNLSKQFEATRTPASGSISL